MARGALALAVLLIAAAAAQAAGTRPREEVWPRVEHHLQEIERLAEHFHAVMDAECPRYSTPDEWRAYVDGEIEDFVTLVAHVEQAWVEAKTTGDDDVRRAAKAPRRRIGEARPLIDKLQGCAPDGTKIDAGAVWERIEEEVPGRQAEIALPAR